MTAKIFAAKSVGATLALALAAVAVLPSTASADCGDTTLRGAIVGGAAGAAVGSYTAAHGVREEGGGVGAIVGVLVGAWIGRHFACEGHAPPVAYGPAPAYRGGYYEQNSYYQPAPSPYPPAPVLQTGAYARASAGVSVQAPGYYPQAYPQPYYQPQPAYYPQQPYYGGY